MLVYRLDEIASKIDWERSKAYDGKLPKYLGLVKVSEKSYEIYGMENGVRYQIGFLKTLEEL